MATLREIENKRRKHYKAAASSFRKVLKEQKALFYFELPRQETPERMQALADNYFIDFRLTKEAFFKIYLTTFPEFANTVTIENKAPSGWWETYVKNWLELNSGERIKQIDLTSKDDIVRVTREVLSEGQKNGESIFQMSKQITTKLKGFDPYRAERIARTEVVSAANMGSYKGAIMSGATHKTWLAARDHRTRKSHAKLNRTTIPMNEKFKISKHGMLYPLDPDGDANEVIQCRCGISFSIK